VLQEIVLVFCVIFHGVNGARIAIFDLFQPRGWNSASQNTTALWTLGIAVVLWLPAAAIMMRNLLMHSFGWFGGA